MPDLIRSFRARFSPAVSRVGMLLGMAGLAALGLEDVSSGHGHLAGAHTVHHHHLYAGQHQHPDRPSGHDPTPDPQDRDARRSTATFSAAPALFQPVAVSVLAAPRVNSAPLLLALALPLVVRHVVRTAGPRAPPFSIAGLDSLD